MANFQKHAGSPASSRHVVYGCNDELVVALGKRICRRSSRQSMVKGNLECLHAFDELSGFVGVCFPNGSSSHEVLHRSHNIFGVLGWRGVALNDAGIPVSNDKSLLDRVVAQLGRLASIHEVKGDEIGRTW